jgi:hypothetical protein
VTPIWQEVGSYLNASEVIRFLKLRSYGNSLLTKELSLAEKARGPGDGDLDFAPLRGRLDPAFNL